jgi:DNA repair protein RadC
MIYSIVSERKAKYGIQIKDDDDVFEAVKRYRDAEQEQFIVLTLNANHDVITVRIVSIGLVTKTIVHPREVFVHALRDMAAAIIVCHNHTSGALIFSDEDREVTERLVAAGELLGIPVLDHVLIARGQDQCVSAIRLGIIG